MAKQSQQQTARFTQLSEKPTGKILLAFAHSSLIGLFRPYTLSRSSTAWEFPSCIYTPANTQDVVFAVKVLGFTKSKYAIRSGGHSPLADWASIDDGVLISMANISNMAYDASAETVLVGFGRRWGELYELLESFDRLVVGGRVPSVGLALTIGGKAVTVLRYEAECF